MDGAGVEEFRRQGYSLVKNAVPQDEIDSILAEYLEVVNRQLGTSYVDPQDPELIRRFKERPDELSIIYDQCRELARARALSLSPALTSIAKAIVGPEAVCYDKRPFRVDVPMETKELAHWHQDHHYVQGNTETIVAWVPLGDVRWLNGCLSVMPGTHKQGVIAHELSWGKKQVPGAVFQNPVYFIEMERGDVLFFDILLLHSGNMNYSDRIRYSLQFRYSPAGLPTNGPVLEI